jgi:hypothetical protein
MGRKPCCDKVGLKKGPWTAEEDQKLVSFINAHGLGCWRAVPKLAGNNRDSRSHEPRRSLHLINHAQCGPPLCDLVFVSPP